MYSGYTPAFDSHTTKGSHSQKFEFDSPDHIAKQLSQQQGGQAFNAPPPPPLPQKSLMPASKLTLRTRDWNGTPWSQEGSSAPKPNFSVLNRSTSPWRKQSTISSTTSSHSPSLLGVYDPALLSAQTTHLQQPSPSANTDLMPQNISVSSGLPSTNYQPSSTIPLHHGGYHLPSSPLALSNVDAPLSTGQSNIPTPPALPNWSNESRSVSKSTPLRTHNWGTRSENGWSNLKPSLDNNNNNTSSNIPNPPALPKHGLSLKKKGSQAVWNDKHAYGFGSPLRKSNLIQKLQGQEGQSQGQAPALGHWNQAQWGNGQWNEGQSTIPTAPRMASLFRQRKWARGPYSRKISLRTRNWGVRTEDGWSNFNRGIFIHESVLPFNQSRSLNDFIAPITNSAPIFNNAPITAPITNSIPYTVPITSSVPYSAPITPIGVPLTQTVNPLTAPALTGRKGRRAAKKQFKLAAIEQTLNTNLNAPVGDPAVNHYRRGAKATVPLVGPATVAPSTGSVVSRRRGRRNNLGRHGAGHVLPVPATQAPFVAPVAASQFPNATYRTLYNNNGTVFPSSQFVQPTNFTSISNGVPLTSSVQQSFSPLSSGVVAPMQPVVGVFEKKVLAPAQVLRPTGAAAF